MDRDTLLDLIPAYELGALDPDERAEVETFLKNDPEAQKLQTEYRAITEALVLAAPARRAPAHLNDDLRQRLAAQRTATPAPELKVIPSRRQRRAWLPVALAAAAVFAIVVAGLLLINRPKEPVIGAEAALLYQNIAAQANARHIPIAFTNTTTQKGELVIAPDGTQAVIHVADLPKLEADKTFQLWLIDENGAHSAGLLRFGTSGEAQYFTLPLEKPAGQYQAIGLSIEPSGGSQQPSADRVFVVAI